MPIHSLIFFRRQPPRTQLSARSGPHLRRNYPPTRSRRVRVQTAALLVPMFASKYWNEHVVAAGDGNVPADESDALKSSRLLTNRAILREIEASPPPLLRLSVPQ